MSPIERSDAHGKRQIKKLIFGAQFEILYCRLPEIEAACRQLTRRPGTCLVYRLFRTIDCQNESVPDAPGHFTSSNAGAAPDLQHTNPASQWKGLNKVGYPR